MYTSISEIKKVVIYNVHNGIGTIIHVKDIIFKINPIKFLSKEYFPKDMQNMFNESLLNRLNSNIVCV